MSENPQTPLSRHVRGRYMVEGPFHPWNQSITYGDWTAIRCKNSKTLVALERALMVPSLFLCPKSKQGTTLFIPTEAWNGFAIGLIEDLPWFPDLETVKVYRKEHLRATFLSRLGRPAHSRQHAWYKASDQTRSGTPQNMFSSIFLVAEFVDKEMEKADEEFKRTEEKLKKATVSAEGKV